MQGLFVGAACEQTRVCHQSPAHHHGFQLWKFRLQLLHVCQGEDIAIVAQRVFTVAPCEAEHGHIHIPIVELLAYPGVDGQLFDGVAVVDFQNGIEFLRIFKPQPGLDGNGQGSAAENFLQESVQGVNIPQHAAALALGDHRAGGTAQIQVHFGIAPVFALLGGPEEVRGYLGQQLGDSGEAFRIRIGKLPVLPVGQAPVNGGGEEGHIVAVHTGEIPVVQTAVDAVSQALHGGEIVLHM